MASASHAVTADSRARYIHTVFSGNVNTYRGDDADREKMSRADPLLFVSICVVSGSLAQVLWKKALLENPLQVDNLLDLVKLSTLRNLVSNPLIVLGVGLYAASVLLYLGAVSQWDVSKTYPLLGTAYILTAFLAWLFLKEFMTPGRLFGTVLIVLGAYMVAST